MSEKPNVQDKERRADAIHFQNGQKHGQPFVSFIPWLGQESYGMHDSLLDRERL
ncbi:hypothetical protein BH24GEM2_BH24GEM2_12190 [soil metagenome]